MNKPLVMLGGGGHAMVLLEILEQQDALPVAIISDIKPDLPKPFCDIAHFASDAALAQFSPDEVMLVNAIGSVPGKTVRMTLFEKYKAAGYQFKTITASSAIISPYALIEEGAQILQGAVVQARAQIGQNCIINTRASVDHDCRIGKHSHIAPGVSISGNVNLGEGVHVGTGAAIIHAVSVGSHSVIGAGATITRSLGESVTVYPAKPHIVDGGMRG